MRTIEQIEHDIAFVERDISELNRMHAGTATAMADLCELYAELEAAKRREEYTSHA